MHSYNLTISLSPTLNLLITRHKHQNLFHWYISTTTSCFTMQFLGTYMIRILEKLIFRDSLLLNLFVGVSQGFFIHVIWQIRRVLNMPSFTHLTWWYTGSFFHHWKESSRGVPWKCVLGHKHCIKMDFANKDSFSTFTEETPNRKLHFLCRETVLPCSPSVFMAIVIKK